MKKLIVVLMLIVMFFPLQLIAQGTYRGIEVGQGINSADIDAMVALLGAPKVVRMPMIMEGMDDATRDEYEAWIDQALAEVDAVLPTFESYGIKVILALYSPPGGFASRGRPSLHRLFVESWAQEEMIETWQKIAQRYKDNTTIWGYDVINEPAEKQVAKGLLNWLKLEKAIAQAIRAIDATHKIILQPKYGNPIFLKRYKKHFVSGVVYSFHMYYPRTFIKQGLDQLKMPKKYKAKNKKKMRQHLMKVRRFQRKKKAKIYLGEFSVVRWAPEKDAVRYLRDLVRFADKWKWHWTYQAWRGAHMWDLELGSDKNDLTPVSSITARAQLFKDLFAQDQ
jgi:endoglucanase